MASVGIAAELHVLASFPYRGICAQFVKSNKIQGGDRPLLIVGLVSTRNALYGFGSTDHPEYVPALCTHRPSLLPMDFSVSLRDWERRFYLHTYGNLNEQCGLKEREVVTRHR